MTHDRNEHLPENRPIQNVSSDTQQQGSQTKETNRSKITSAARVAANQRNAQNSTGPRTSEGKARSRWNAVQHGLLAKRLFIRDQTDRSTFEHLLASLRSEWQPEGVLEEILLEKIAMGYYKLHVVYGHEAEFARSASQFYVSIDRTGRYATSINRQLTQDINQFERLHRQRKGEFVPAPIHIDVTVTGINEAGQIDALSTVTTVKSAIPSIDPNVPYLSTGIDEAQLGPHDMEACQPPTDLAKAAELSPLESTPTYCESRSMADGLGDAELPNEPKMQHIG